MNLEPLLVMVACTHKYGTIFARFAQKGPVGSMLSSYTWRLHVIPMQDLGQKCRGLIRGGIIARF